MVSLKSFIHRISNLRLIERIPFYSRFSLEVPRIEYDYHFKFIMNGLGSRFLIDKSYWFVFENLKNFFLDCLLLYLTINICPYLVKFLL